ncbi:MAG: PEP-CTERM sorting domain-containing protein [Desulfobacterales bacterium]|nr:PEP-CTERM sorting domain-containing protein [Desulfobacterales bacterium]
MKKLFIISSILIFLICSGGLAGATLITFDSLTQGDSMQSYSEAGVTFSTTTDALLYVYPHLLRTGIAGNTENPFVPIRADFDDYASSVSVLLGDLCFDTEEIYLNAYNESDILIGQTIVTLDGEGWMMVSVAASAIDHVIWSSINNEGPYYDNTLLADSFEFTADPVPEPATMFLLASGLIGLAGFRRRFKKR